MGGTRVARGGGGEFAKSVARYVDRCPARVMLLSRTNVTALGELLGSLRETWPSVPVDLVASARVLAELPSADEVLTVALSRNPAGLLRAVYSLARLRKEDDLVLVVLPHLTHLSWTTWLWARLARGRHRVLYCDGAQVCRDWRQAQEELDLVAPRPHPLRAARAALASVGPWLVIAIRGREVDGRSDERRGRPQRPPQAWRAALWLAVGERAFRILGRRPGRPPEPPEVRRVLIIEPDLLGDVVWGTPLIEASGRYFPKAEIDVLVGPWAAALLSGDPRVTRVIEYAAPWFASIAPSVPRGARAWWGRVRTRIGLFEARYDVVLEPRGEVRQIRLAYLTGAPLRAGHALRSIDGKHTPESWVVLLTHRVPYDWNARHSMHQSERNMEPLRALGYDGDTPPARLAVDPAAELSARERVSRGTAGDGPVAVLVPGASRVEKRWAPAGFGEVAKALALAGVRAVVSGTAAEIAVAEEVVLASGRTATSLAGQIGLAEYLALLARADVVICNETAAIAICSAVGTPVVALMTGVPALYGPRGVPCAVVQHKLECYEPVIEHCACPWPRYRCLDLIEPVEVIRAASGLFGAKASGSATASPDRDGTRHT